MFKKFESSLLLAAKILMFLLCAAVFFLIYGQKYSFLLIPTRTSIVTLGVFLIMYVGMTIIYGGFDIGKRKSKPIINSLVLSVLFTDIVAHFFMCIMNVTVIHDGKFVYEYPLLLLAIYVFQVFLIILMSYTCNDLYFSLKKPQNCIVIARQGENTKDIIAKVGRYKKQYNITKVVYINDRDLFKEIDATDGVFFYNLSVPERNAYVEYCYHFKKDIYYSVELSDIISLSGKRVYFDDKSMVHASVNGITFEQRIIKRIMDLAIAGFGLLITSPIFLITAICIKAEDNGPVFYRQERATYGGRSFEVLKFRSMKTEDGSIHKSVTKDDDRITKVGRFIRKFRIDELPQLINVIKSDMSIVGPRPEMLENVEKYTRELPEFEYRQRAKAGLTGMAQIYGKYNTSPKDKLIFDMTYINQYSVWLDIKLIFRTLLVLLTPDQSTEAFEDNSQDKN
ncbi:MAG: exopolysaccharide biosynthesis polyprenyl glycosylphosphotransferase [Acutalibacteraceae bacterium]|nr:exopolysaccharide biosynthesis polyprenyl glycosylphosphotransferase [Acutalibacteraceae bacterium]